MDYYDYDGPEDEDSEYYEYETPNYDNINFLENRQEELGHCVHQVLSSSLFDLILPIVFFNFLLKAWLYFQCRFTSNSNYQKPTAIIGSIFLLYHFWTRPVLAIFLLTFIVGISICSAYKYVSSTSQLWALCLIAVACNEILLYYWDRDFFKLRPLMMMVVMKVIAHGSQESKAIHLPSHYNFNELLAYLLHPEGLPAGGYHPHIKPSPIFSFTCLKKALATLFCAILFLLVSTCLSQILISSWVYLLLVESKFYFPSQVVHFVDLMTSTYLTALQFRTSHYFMCFVMEFGHQFWNYETSVTKPLMVEVPRSLVDVVVAWNIPMHSWLKTHVFEHAKVKYGPLKAILITYFISSFLHGVNFQIWCVLLSLGVLTWSEFVLRKKLADIYSACIEARPCPMEGVTTSVSLLQTIKTMFTFGGRNEYLKCKRAHKFTGANSYTVRLINVAFGLLAMVHLAFLGSSFDGKEEPSNFHHVVETWTNLKFYSHIIAVITIFMYKAID